MKAKAGRPTDFTPAIGDEICERIAEAESLRRICQDDHMPNKATVFRWLAKAEEAGALEGLRVFRDQYARAHEAKADTLVDQIGEIHEKAWVPFEVDGVPLVVDGKPVMTVDKASAAAARLEADNKKWLAMKLAPKKYGEKVQAEVSGPNGGPVQSVTRIELVPLSGNRKD